MKFTELYYEKVFPIAPYVNEKIGVKISIEEGEDAKAAIEAAREFAQECFDEKYPPNLTAYSCPKDVITHWQTVRNEDGSYGVEYSKEEPPVVAKEKPDPKEKRIKQIADSFNGCTSVANLETFKLLVQKENDESLTAAYESKLSSLTTTEKP